MTTATKEPTEVYCPEWLATRISHMADAVNAARSMIHREDTFLSVMEASEGDGQASNGAREVWGAQQVLKDVWQRLSAIREDPAEYADEVGCLVGELWQAGYRLNAAAVTLREHDGHGENAYHVVSIVEALADGLNGLGALTDERQGREAKGGES